MSAPSDPKGVPPPRRSGVDLHAAGIGSMVVDRVHRVARIVAADQKGLLREDGNGPVRTAVGGVVLNHLGWAALLGLRVGIFGRQGDDEGGRFLRAAMDRAGIVRDVAVVDEPSSLAEIFVDDDGGRAIYMARGATGTTSASHVRDRHAAFISRAAVLTTEVSQLPLEAALAAMDAARRAGADVWVDLDVPATDAVPGLGSQSELEAVLSGATLLKPSKVALSDWHGAGGIGAADGDLGALARAVRSRFGNDVVAVTAGERGCGLSWPDGEVAVAAPRVAVVDTTGAGDAFLGGLLAAAVSGLDWPAAARLGNACGGACCEQLGAFPEDPERALARVRELAGGPLPGPPRSSGRPPTGSADP